MPIWNLIGTLPSGSGTVTSVALSLGGGVFTVSGSPVTTSGTLTGALATQTANRVFCGPTTGSAAAPTFRALVSDDIPGLAASKIISGTLAPTVGGTGLATYILGDVLYCSAANTLAALAGNTTTDKLFLSQTGDGANSAAPAWSAVTATDVGLGNVENTALSTWAGSTNLVTLGTVATGTWNGTTIGPTYGGTGLTTYTLGDVLYASAADTLAVLAGNTTTAKQFLSQTGDGANSAAPAWSAIAASDITSGTLAVTRGGTGLATYTLGDILYCSAADTLAALAGNTTTTKKYLTQTGDGANSAAPVWEALSGTATWTEEVPAGTIDGSNAVFTLAQTPVTPLMLYVNGIFQTPAGNDYTRAGDTITFETGAVPQAGDSIYAVYGY